MSLRVRFMTLLRFATMILSALMFAPAIAWAAVPSSISVQGKVTDLNGVPLSAGEKTFVFRIFDSSALGNKVWPGTAGEAQTITTAADGLWVGLVGAIEPMTSIVFSDTLRWLEIEVDGTPLPRIRLVTGPFAYRVASVDRASGGEISSSLSVGPTNDVSGPNAFASGTMHVASGANSATIGGSDNDAVNDGAVVAGGSQNLASGNNAFIGGGTGNATASHSFVGAGESNRATGQNAAIIGGLSDTAAAFRSAVVGGAGNAITSLGTSSTILGGELNRITQELSVIGNGESNSISNVYSVIGGGFGNAITGPWSVIDGGSGNLTTSQGSVIGGGYNNRARGFYATVGGGGGAAASDSNQAAGPQSTVGGGRRNIAAADQTTVAGGDGNRALSAGAFVGGGVANIASGLNAAISGGASDTANGSHSMIPGGFGNRASGLYSFAAGRRAKAQHDGAFVWADDQNSDFATNNSRQFLIRAANGVGINTNAPEKALHVLGSAKIRDTLFASFVSSNSPLSLQTFGTTRMYIDETTGNIGINSGIPPTARLQVGGVIHSASGGVRFPDGRTQTIGGLIAFGHIGQDGTLQASSGNISSSFDVVNTRYLITITGETYVPLSYVTIVTCNGLAATFIPGVSGLGGQLVVTMFNTAGGKVQAPFQFVTYRP